MMKVAFNERFCIVLRIDSKIQAATRIQHPMNMPICRHRRNRKLPTFFQSLAKAIIACLLWTGTAHALPGFQPETTKISLITVDRGDQIYMFAGHLLLRVQDSVSGKDYVINWGLFDFKDPNFLFNYLKGILIYRSGIAPTKLMFEKYQRQGRTIWQDSLRLTPIQTSLAIDKFSWWLAPENRSYRYDLWRQNCSTIIRDIIGSALGAKFASQYEAPIGLSFREVGQKYFRNFPALAILAPILTNSSIDSEITAWEKFLNPLSVRELLGDSKAFDDQSNPLDLPLIFQTKTVSIGQSIPILSYNYGVYFLAALGLFALVAFASHKTRGPKTSLRVIGVGAALIFTLSGTLGTVLLLMWAFTEHVATHANANLLLYWPLDFLFVYAAIRFPSIKGVPLKSMVASPIHKMITRLALCKLVMIPSVFVLWVAGFITQDLSVSFYYVAPCLLAPLILFRWGKKALPEREKEVDGADEDLISAA
jgi:hypothetical protein